MSEHTPTVHVAEGTDASAIKHVILLAFASDPMLRWVFSDPGAYVTHGPDFVLAFGGRALEHESAWYIDGYRGAALWLPPDVAPEEEQLMAAVQAVLPERLEDLMAVAEQITGHKPKEPFWYLPLIGIDPRWQGRGFGGLLLKASLERCDRDDVPAYLEASSRRSVPLYQQHGFEVCGRVQAGSSPEIYPMIRPPRSG
jgi:GNAT superfamily N-acetyltransferase